MKKIDQIREQYDLITEKEEAETRKLTSLVRAGLFDPKKLPMLKRALSKDPKDMTPAERKILIELLDSLMAEVLQSQQVYSKVKQNVMMKEEELDEAVGKTFDGYYSKYDPRYAKMPSEREIPTVIILKRKAIRIYPDNQKVALYYSQALDKYVTIPFGTFEGGSINEAVKSKKSNPDDEDKRQALRSRIAAAQALRDQMAAQKEKVNKLTTEPVKSEPEPEKEKPVKKQKSSKDKEKTLDKSNQDFYKKKITSKMDLGRAKVLMKRDANIDTATRVGTLAGLASRRAWNNSSVKKAIDKVKSSYKIGKNQAKNIDTTFEESDIKSKFYAKRHEQLDEFTMTPVNPAVAGRVGVSPRVGSRPTPSTSGTSTFSLKKKYENPFVDTEKVEDLLKKKKDAPAKAQEQPKVKDWSKSFNDTKAPKTPVEVPMPSAPPEAVPEPAPKRVSPTEVPMPSAPPEAVPEKKPVAPAQTAAPAATPAATPKSDATPTPKSDNKQKRGGLGRTIGKGIGIGATLAGAALLGFDVDKKPTEQKPFTMQVKKYKPVGNVRTGIEARDTAIYRKTMQQNESVLNALYSIKDNEEKPIQIANESVVINNTVAKKIIGLYESVNRSNKEKIESMLNESVDSFKKIASFAARQ